MILPRVVGIDLSLTATGIALPDGTLDTITTGPGPLLTDQRDRLRHITDEIAARTNAGKVGAPHLAVIEGPSYGSKGAGTWDRGGLWWLVVDRLMGEAVDVAVVPPAVLKRYATGRGNAVKADMRVAWLQRTGADVRDDNAVDAAWLRCAGLDHLGTVRDRTGLPPATVPKAQRDALGKVDWPEVAS